MNLPFFNFYARDWLADTQHMTYEQKGVYHDLLCHMWLREDCQLPDDERFMTGLLHVSVAKWRALRAFLVEGYAPVLRLTDGFLCNRRLKEERAKADKKSEVRAKAADSRWHGGGSKAMQKQSSEDANAMQMHSKSNANDMHPESESELTPLTPQGDSASAENAEVETQEPPPEPSEQSLWFEQQFWPAYPKNASGQKPNKDRARRKAEKLAKRDLSAIMDALKRYKTSDKVQRGIVKNPDGFLSEDYWRSCLDIGLPEEHGPDLTGDTPPKGYCWDRDEDGRFKPMQRAPDGTLPWGLQSMGQVMERNRKEWERHGVGVGA